MKQPEQIDLQPHDSNGADIPGSPAFRRDSTGHLRDCLMIVRGFDY